MEVAARHSRHSPLQVGVGVRRDRRECRESTGREPSCPPIAGDIRRRRWLSQARRHPCLVPGLPLPQARRSREITPPDRLWLNARLWLCPPARRCPKARRIAADSSPPDCRWLKPTGSALIHPRWPPLSLAPWIKSTCDGQECRVSVLSCPQEHFNYLVLSCPWRLVWGRRLLVLWPWRPF